MPLLAADMSGGRSASGRATIGGMVLVDHVPNRHAKIAPLSRRAARLLLMAREMAGPDGEVPGGQRALARELGISDLSAIRKAMIELEGRRLAWRAGVLRIFVADVPNRHAVDEQQDIPEPPLRQRYRRDRGRLRNVADARFPGSGGNPEFRWLRAQVGGLRRAADTFKSERDEARAILRKIEARAGDDRERAAMRADLDHAVDCAEPGCALCERMMEQLDDPDGSYVSVVRGM